MTATDSSPFKRVRMQDMPDMNTEDDDIFNETLKSIDDCLIVTPEVSLSKPDTYLDALIAKSMNTIPSDAEIDEPPRSITPHPKKTLPEPPSPPTPFSTLITQKSNAPFTMYMRFMNLHPHLYDEDYLKEKMFFVKNTENMKAWLKGNASETARGYLKAVERVIKGLGVDGFEDEDFEDIVYSRWEGDLGISEEI